MDLKERYNAAPKRYDAGDKIFRRRRRSGVLPPKISLGFWKNFGDAASSSLPSISK